MFYDGWVGTITDKRAVSRLFRAANRLSALHQKMTGLRNNFYIYTDSLTAVRGD
jgi:hypothetical protein